MSSRAVPAALLERACAPYRAAGRFAYHFARGKLRGDPVYRALLERGLLRGPRRLLDLGCGQGLLAAWLRAAEQVWRSGGWPAQWPPAPQDLAIRGIELLPREVRRAQRALGQQADIAQGDIRVAALGSADAVAMLDVLQYLAADAQQAVLQRVRGALPHGGLLLLRVADAAGGLRFHFSQWTDMAVMLAWGRDPLELHCRSVACWRALLGECGFDSQAVPMSEGTPFANVLLIARAR